MAVLNNPINVAHVDAYAGVLDVARVAEDYEVERACSEVFLRWLLFYFSGNAFSCAEVDGSVTVRTFRHCEVMVGPGKLPQPLVRPLIHVIQGGMEDEDIGHSPGFLRKRANLRWNVFVRTTQQADEAGLMEGEHLCREVAGQLRWLLEGSERHGLGDRGLTHVKLLSGPVSLQNANYFMRQIVVGMQGDYRIRYGI